MVKTIFDLVNEGSRGGALVKATPELWGTLQQLAEEEFFYAVTVTVSRQYKPPNQRRYLYKMSAQMQMIHFKREIRRIFNNMIYLCAFEYTKAGVIHAHLFVAYPGAGIDSSLVRQTIKNVLSRFGPRQDINKVSSYKSWFDYIVKERTHVKDNMIWSKHFGDDDVIYVKTKKQKMGRKTLNQQLGEMYDEDEITLVLDDYYYNK